MPGPIARRRIAAGLTTALAGVLVLLALLAPDEFGRLTPAAFVSIPLDGVLGVALLLFLPARARAAAATLFGLALGLLTIMKLLDTGFFAVLDRPFDPVLDWMLLDDAMRFLAGSIGPVPAIGSLAIAVVLSTALVIFMTRSVQHLARLVVRHNLAAAPQSSYSLASGSPAPCSAIRSSPAYRSQLRAQPSTSSTVTARRAQLYRIGRQYPRCWS